eukprot:5630875-Amphidinium_carterae.1
MVSPFIASYDHLNGIQHLKGERDKAGTVHRCLQVEVDLLAASGKQHHPRLLPSYATVLGLKKQQSCFGNATEVLRTPPQKIEHNFSILFHFWAVLGVLIWNIVGNAGGFVGVETCYSRQNAHAQVVVYIVELPSLFLQVEAALRDQQ